MPDKLSDYPSMCLLLLTPRALPLDVHHAAPHRSAAFAHWQRDIPVTTIASLVIYACIYGLEASWKTRDEKPCCQHRELHAVILDALMHITFSRLITVCTPFKLIAHHRMVEFCHREGGICNITIQSET